MRTRTFLTLVVAVVATTAATLAAQANQDPPPRVAFVAHAFNPADALAVGPIAGQLNAPLFTTAPDALSAPAAAGLVTYGPDLVLVAGGSGAIADMVLDQIREATGLPDDAVERVFGTDRTATAAALARLFDERGWDRAFLAIDGTADSAETAADSGRLGGDGPEAFARTGHDHFGQTWTGNGATGLSLVGDVPLDGPKDAVLSAVNTHDVTQPDSDPRTFGIYAEVESSSIASLGAFPQNSAAVFGWGTGSASTGSPYDGFGVYGRSGSNDELWQPVGSVGVVGTGDSRGLYGSAGSSYGAYATSLNWYGIYGRTSRPDNNYGLYTPDNLHANSVSTTAGTVSTVMRNVGTQPLEAGDVVVFAGMDESLVGDTPTPTVATTATADDPAVAGVVLSRFDPVAADTAPDDPAAPDGLDPTPDGAVAPGEYLLVVVQGPARVRAGGTDLQPGAAVSTSAVAGRATRATTTNGEVTRGALLGKAMEAVTDGAEHAWIYVTLG